MKIKSLKSTQGFSMIELISVLAIVGIAVAFILPFFSDISTSTKVSQFRTAYSNVVNKINTFYSPDYDYTDIDTATVVDSKLGPSTALRGSGSSSVIKFSLGDSCVPAVDGSRADLFTMTCTNFPTDSCAEAIKLIEDFSLKIEVGASAGSMTPVKDVLAATPTALDRSQLAQVCAGITGPVYSFKATHR